MKNNKTPGPRDHRIYEDFYDATSVQSSTDMTGAVPTPPITENDAESYSQLQGMPIPGDPPRKRIEKKEYPDEPRMH